MSTTDFEPTSAWIRIATPPSRNVPRAGQPLKCRKENPPSVPHVGVGPGAGRNRCVASEAAVVFMIVNFQVRGALLPGRLRARSSRAARGPIFTARTCEVGQNSV